MTKIYNQEIQDGLAEAIQSNKSEAYCSQLKILDEESKMTKAFAGLMKRANQNQHDLFYLDSILVSVGWNLNDDVFDKNEVWAARNTPVDKQLNIEHDEKKIVGHLTESAVFDQDFNIIPSDTNPNEIPDTFDIVVGSVLYKKWSDPEFQKEVDKLIAEIREDKWFVSMECLFPNFDYALISPEGEHKIIERCEATSFLTKHLRRYGGSGEYDGNKIGRLLRSFSFSGIGIVQQPGNPRSIILSSSANSKFNSETTINAANIEEQNMTTTYSEAQYNELSKKLEKAEADAKKAAEQVVAKQITELEGKITSLEEENKTLASTVETKDEVIKAKEEELKTVNETVASKEEELTEVKKELDELKTKARNTERRMKLEKTSVTAEKAESLIEKFSAVSDELFDELVESLPVKEEAAEMSDKEKKEKEKKEKEGKEYANDKEGEESAKSADLENSEEEANANLSASEEDEAANTRKAVASWFGSNVFKHTEKKN